MAGTLTAAQTADLKWLSGWRARANGKPRPTALPDADGWDDLNIILTQIEALIRTSGPGGYGPPVVIT